MHEANLSTRVVQPEAGLPIMVIPNIGSFLRPRYSLRRHIVSCSSASQTLISRSIYTAASDLPPKYRDPPIGGPMDAETTFVQSSNPTPTHTCMESSNRHVSCIVGPTQKQSCSTGQTEERGYMETRCAATSSLSAIRSSFDGRAGVGCW